MSREGTSHYQLNPSKKTTRRESRSELRQALKGKFDLRTKQRAGRTQLAVMARGGSGGGQFGERVLTVRPECGRQEKCPLPLSSVLLRRSRC